MSAVHSNIMCMFTVETVLGSTNRPTSHHRSCIIMIIGLIPTNLDPATLPANRQSSCGNPYNFLVIPMIKKLCSGKQSTFSLAI